MCKIRFLNSAGYLKVVTVKLCVFHVENCMLCVVIYMLSVITSCSIFHVAVLWGLFLNCFSE